MEKEYNSTKPIHPTNKLVGFLGEKVNKKPITLLARGEKLRKVLEEVCDVRG